MLVHTFIPEAAVLFKISALKLKLYTYACLQYSKILVAWLQRWGILIHAQLCILLPCSLFGLITTRIALNDMAGQFAGMEEDFRESSLRSREEETGTLVTYFCCFDLGMADN